VGEILDHLAGPMFGKLMERMAPAASPLGDDYHTAQEYRHRFILQALIRS
jgi:hypothetical protein